MFLNTQHDLREVTTFLQIWKTSRVVTPNENRLCLRLSQQSVQENTSTFSRAHSEVCAVTGEDFVAEDEPAQVTLWPGDLRSWFRSTSKNGHLKSIGPAWAFAIRHERGRRKMMVMRWRQIKLDWDGWTDKEKYRNAAESR